MDVLEAIRSRRSIRAYRSTPVDEKTLTAVLEAARQAPSWANSQTWRFIVIRDDSIKAGLAGAAIKSTNRGFNAVKQAPVVIVCCSEQNRAGCRDGQPVTDKGGYWFMFDAALALENLVLAAQSLGLGTLYIGGFDAQKAAGFLGVPPGYAVVAIVPLGYPDEQPEAKPRKELAEIVFHDRFGNK
ncbi:MAG: nitroreductase family protein [Chloroflexota bacterium]